MLCAVGDVAADGQPVGIVAESDDGEEDDEFECAKCFGFHSSIL